MRDQWKQNLIADVMKGNGLEYKSTQMTGRWVSDALQEVLATWDCTFPGLRQPVLINAPTGSGKSTFILNDLASYAGSQGKYVLLLSNRYALSLQQKKILMQINNNPILGQEVVSGLLQFSNVLVLTYQKVLGLITYIQKMCQNQIGFIVFDEVHFFVSDASFNPDTCGIYKSLLQYFPCCRRIYLSATPEDVKPLIAYEERNLLQWFKDQTNPVYRQSAAFGNYSDIIEYYFPADYSFVELNFPCSWDDVIQKCNDSSEKWLIFVSSKDIGRQLKGKIKGAEFIDASTKNIRPSFVAELVNSEMFRQRVLIATSTLDNGINFKDPQLKNIVVDTIDEVQAKQMLGRKRRDDQEVVNLYVMQKIELQIEEYSNAAQRSKGIYLTFRKDPVEFYANFWGELSENQQQLFGLWSDPNSDPNAKTARLYTNDYAIWQLERFIGNCEMLKARFVREGDIAFIKEVCGWFGQEYDPEMGESLFERIKKRVIDFITSNTNIGQPIEKSALKTFVAQLIAVCEPLLPQINKKSKIYDDEGHYKADANNIFKFFSILYLCDKLTKKEADGKELWRFVEVTDSSTDSEDYEDDTEE